MGTLFTFGCSYTEDFERVIETTKNNNFMSAQRRYIEKHLGGRIPKSWPQLLGEKLGFELKNYGVGGMSNYQIFEEICEHSDEFKNEDVIIIGWTHITRFRWIGDSNDWSPVFSQYTDNISKIMSESTFNEILIQRNKKLYIKELYYYQKLLEQLSKSIEFKIYFWSSDDDIIIKEGKDFLNDKKYLLNNNINETTSIFRLINNNGGKTIHQETNGEIPDNHLGESGHKVQAELFYNHIINEK
jgi:hypothetical protein